MANILIADDDLDDIELLAGDLKLHGHHVTVCRDGKTALEEIRNEHPDLVILDILMPGIDGPEVGMMLRSDETTKNIPIVFLTGLKKYYENDGFDVADPNIVVAKPVNRLQMGEFRKLIEQLLYSHRT